MLSTYYQFLMVFLLLHHESQVMNLELMDEARLPSQNQYLRAQNCVFFVTSLFATIRTDSRYFSFIEI